MSSPPERTVFFVDRCLGRKIVPHALRAAGEIVVVHDDHFRPDDRDEVWLARAGQEGWVVLSSDKRIRYRINELEALKAARVRAFVFTAKRGLPGEEIAVALVKALPAIKRFSDAHRPPFIAHVWRDGSVRLMQVGA